MDLDFSEEQRLLRETLRGLCGEHVDGARLRAGERDPAGFDGAFWAALAGLGVTGLRIPEVYGGSGLGMLEAAIVQEELGRCLAPSPLAPSAFFAARLVQLAGDPAQQRVWLPGIAAGRGIGVPAWQESGRSPEIRTLGLPAVWAGARVCVSGSKTLVPFAGSAHALLVPVQLDGALGIHLGAAIHARDQVVQRAHRDQAHPAQGTGVHMAHGPVRVVAQGVDRLDRHHRTLEGRHAIKR